MKKIVKLLAVACIIAILVIGFFFFKSSPRTEKPDLDYFKVGNAADAETMYQNYYKPALEKLL